MVTFTPQQLPGRRRQCLAGHAGLAPPQAPAVWFFPIDDGLPWLGSKPQYTAQLGGVR